MTKIPITTIVETPSGKQMAEKWELRQDLDLVGYFSDMMDDFNSNLRTGEEPRKLVKILLGHTRWEGTPNPEEIGDMSVLWEDS